LRAAAVRACGAGLDRRKKWRWRPWLLGLPRYAVAPSGSRLGHGPLADDDLDCRWNSAPYQSQIDSAARAVRPEELHDFAHAIDWFCIPSHDDVTHEQSGARGRPIRIYVHDKHSAPAARRLRVMGWASAP